MKKIFTAPKFENSEITLQARRFHKLVLGFIIVVVFSLTINIIVLPQNIIRWSVVIFLFSVIGVLLLYLNKQGLTRLAGYIFVSLCFVLIFLLSWSAGGIKATAIQFLPIVVLLSGLLLGWKKAIVFGFAAAITGLLLVLFEYLGYVPISAINQTPISIWINNLTLISLVTLLQYLSVVNLNIALTKSHEELDFRIHLEAVLKTSEARYRSIFENANDAIFIMKGDRFIDCNTKTLDIFKCTREQILHQTPYFFSPAIQPDGVKSMQKALNYVTLTLSGFPQRFEWQHCRFDKSTFDAEVSLNTFEANNEIFLQAIVRDITERKKAEEVVREKERRIRAVFDLSYGFIGLLSPDGILLEANHTAIEFAGVKQTDVIGKPFWETPWWNHSVEMQTLIKNAITDAVKGRTISFEAIHPDLNGTLHSIDFSLKPVKDESGKVVLLIPEGRDITARKTANSALKSLAANYAGLSGKAFFEATSKHIATEMGLDYVYVGEHSANTNSIKVLGGYACGEVMDDMTYSLLNTPCSDVMMLDTCIFPNGVQQQFPNDVLLKQMDIESYIGAPILNKEHKSIGILVALHTKPLLNPNTVSNFFNIFLDRITAEFQRMKANEALRESEERFRLILENMPILLNAFDENGDIIVWNKACENSTGYRADEVIGNSKALELLYPDPDYRAEVLNASNDSNYVSEIFNLETKQGEIRTIEWFDIYHFLNIPGWASWGLGQDITERKNAEMALLERQKFIESLIDISPGIIYIYDIVEQKNIFSNEGVEKILGYSKIEVQEMGNQVIPILMHPEDLNIYLDKIITQYAFAKDNEQIVHQYRMKNKNGNYQWIESTEIIYKRQDDGSPQQIFGLGLDVTERRHAEDKLKASISLLDASLESTADGILIVNNQGQITKWNLKFAELWQLSEATLSFKDDASILNNILSQLSNPSQFADKLKYLYSHPDESSFDQINFLNGRVFERYSQPHRIGNDIVGRVWSFRDITERVKAEEALRESKEKFLKIFDRAPVLISVTGFEDGVYVDVNSYALDFSGYSREEVIGRKSTDIGWVSLENRAILAKTLASEGRIDGLELDFKTKNGKTIYGLVNGEKIKLDNKECLITITTDITERKLAEKALRESEEKLSALFSSMTEMVVLHEVVFNDNGQAINYRITDCNDAFTEITGIKKENAIGKLASDVYQTDTPPYLHEFTQVGITGEPYEFTSYYEPMDKHFMISVVSPQKNKFATITTDITAIKQIQEVITTKNKELENYLYVASHDLRSPLVNIHGFSLRLQKQADAIKTVIDNCPLESDAKISVNKITNDDLPKTLGYIFSNVTKMDTLINGLLQISRTGRIVMTIRKIDMNQMFKNILESFNYQITEISANIIINDMPFCYGDENQLNQLFSNIINNAIKYRDPNRQLVIKIVAQSQYNKIIYSIQDTGAGIAQRHMEKIWDVFFRVDSSSALAGEGIGLSLAKRIAEKHKGRIWANSEEGKGSTFYVELQKDEFVE